MFCFSFVCMSVALFCTACLQPKLLAFQYTGSNSHSHFVSCWSQTDAWMLAPFRLQGSCSFFVLFELHGSQRRWDPCYAFCSWRSRTMLITHGNNFILHDLPCHLQLSMSQLSLYWFLLGFFQHVFSEAALCMYTDRDFVQAFHRHLDDAPTLYLCSCFMFCLRTIDESDDNDVHCQHKLQDTGKRCGSRMHLLCCKKQADVFIKRNGHHGERLSYRCFEHAVSAKTLHL